MVNVNFSCYFRLWNRIGVHVKIVIGRNLLKAHSRSRSLPVRVVGLNPSPRLADLLFIRHTFHDWRCSLIFYFRLWQKDWVEIIFYSICWKYHVHMIHIEEAYQQMQMHRSKAVQDYEQLIISIKFDLLTSKSTSYNVWNLTCWPSFQKVRRVILLSDYHTV